MTRIEQIQANGKDVPMPPLGPAGHVFDYLFDVGPTAHSGMGPVPLGHAEIAAWQSNTGIALNTWEARMLRRLSFVYIAAAHEAEEPSCPAPWTDRPIEDRRVKIGRAVDMAFGSMAGKPDTRRARKAH